MDLYCDRAKLAIELDGSQHYENDSPEYDRRRTCYLQEVEKIRLIRYTNLEVNNNFEGVCADIDRTVKLAVPSSVTASPCHLPPGGGKALGGGSGGRPCGVSPPFA